MSEIDAPENQEKVIAALEVKLALARGHEPKIKNYGRLLSWYDQQSAWKVMEACPKAFYCKLSARQTKLIDDHAAAFGLPITSGSVNLPRVIQWFHTYLAKWGPQIAKKRLSEDRLSELAERKMEAELEQINKKLISLSIDIQRKEGTAVAIEEVRAAFAWLSSEWRKFGERLGKRFGADAQRLLNEFLERIESDNRSSL